MTTPDQDERRQAIENAAYDVLAEKGFKGTSMLAVARAARASNETMYNWYGDKLGLFASMIRRNAALVGDDLDRLATEQQPPLAALEQAGATLLKMLTGERAVALNRAAAADPTGALGALLARHGRETVGPKVAGVLLAAQAAGKIDFDNPRDATELFFGLLIGDLQIRRVVSRAPQPEAAEVARRAAIAVDRLVRLLPPVAAR